MRMLSPRGGVWLMYLVPELSLSRDFLHPTPAGEAQPDKARRE